MKPSQRKRYEWHEWRTQWDINKRAWRRDYGGKLIWPWDQKDERIREEVAKIIKESGLSFAVDDFRTAYPVIDKREASEIVTFYRDWPTYQEDTYQLDAIGFGGIEQDWLISGKPYFKVYPAIVDALQETDLNVNCEFLRMPFNKFAVLFPKVDRWKEGPMMALVGVAMGLDDNKRKISSIALHASYFDATDLGENGETITRSTCDARLRAGITLDEAFGDEPWSPNALFMMRVVVGTMLFGMGSHEMILPDVPRKHIDKYYEARKRGDKATEGRLANKRPKGFLVGSELDLPEPSVTTHGTREHQGGELEYGHLRRGHLAMQPCGPNNSERKLIFRPPTPVRPDLPFRPHGYRVGREYDAQKAQ